jgi:phosphoribosylglycinamide formyltransferase-1
MTRNIAVFCSGSGSNFEAIVDAARRKKLNACVALLVCDKPGAYALERARRKNIPIALVNPKSFPDREAYEKVIVQILKNQAIDLVVLAGFMRILTPFFIKAFRDRIVNIHPAYLPNFKGAHAIRDAFEAKAKETGVTVHVVTKEVDAGPVILQKKVKISKRDTLESLEKRIHEVEHKLYPLAIEKYLKVFGAK